MILRAKFHVVSSLLSVLKIVIDASVRVPHALPLKISLPKNETTVNIVLFVKLMATPLYLDSHQRLMEIHPTYKFHENLFFLFILSVVVV